MGGQISSICLSPYFSCLSMQVCPVPWIYHRRRERAGKLQHLIYVTAEWWSDTALTSEGIGFLFINKTTNSHYFTYFFNTQPSLPFNSSIILQQTVNLDQILTDILLTDSGCAFFTRLRGSLWPLGLSMVEGWMTPLSTLPPQTPRKHTSKTIPALTEPSPVPRWTFVSRATQLKFKYSGIKKKIKARAFWQKRQNWSVL